MENPSLLPPELELLLIIRFSVSLPDMLLEIPDPTITTAGLKQLIRTKLPEDFSRHRLRLIHAGKALEDSTELKTSLKLCRSSPSRNITPTLPVIDPGDKGKTVIRDPPKPCIYIHCSIGDIVLSHADLAAEARDAASASAQHDVDHDGLSHKSSSLSSTSASGPATTADRGVSGNHSQPGQGEGGPTTISAPRGFDRLLESGLTVAEVSALRSQFRALQSLTRTPDTMPSGAELRRLEDRWMDETSAGMEEGDLGHVGGITNDGGNMGSGVGGALDDMLWGSVMGFFWPVGCALWLLREEGVWSWRKGLAVFVGVVVNLGFGAVRMMS